MVQQWGESDSDNDTMVRAYSNEIRRRVIEKSKARKNVREIADDLKVSKTFVYNILSLQKETGGIIPRKGKRGREPILNNFDMMRIKEEIQKNPDITLNEIKKNLQLDVSIITIGRAKNNRLKLRNYRFVNRRKKDLNMKNSVPS